MGNEVAVSSMPGVAAKNLTFKNGTMDFTSAAQGSTMLNISNNQSVKFEDMTLLIKERDDSTGMFYWIDLVHPTATAYFENCVIDFDDIQYSYICANGDGSVFLKDCEIEAAYGNFVYRAGATFENCTFDGFADLGEGDVAGNMILWAAKPCVLKNTTGYTRQFGSITENGTIAVTEGSYVYAEKVRHYYGPNGPEPNPDKYTAGLITVDKSSTLEAVEADTELFNDASEGVINTEASKIYVQYKKVDVDANGEDNLEGKDKYQIILAGVNDVAAKEIIHELASADLTFAFDGTQAVTGGAMDYAVEPAEGVSLTQKGDRFMFNYDGYKKYQESGAAIPIGTITINGYGTYTLKTDDSVTTNAVYATEIKNSIVDGFTPAAGLVINPPVPVGEDMVGSISATIKVPTKTLTIKVDFPNEVVDQAKAYQEMKVEISGNIDGVNKTIPYELGGKMLADGSYVVTVEDKLVLNNTYTVTVSGKGYRTARYAVNMNDHKELYFWNNVMDKATDVEKGEYSTTTTFLAGDILADNHINIYDLSAVVSHFAEKAGNTENAWKYVEYDLNRDGVVDSKDVAYVLVSWNK